MGICKDFSSHELFNHNPISEAVGKELFNRIVKDAQEKNLSLEEYFLQLETCNPYNSPTNELKNNLSDAITTDNQEESKSELAGDDAYYPAIGG